jgi:hypothetical protein
MINSPELLVEVAILGFPLIEILTPGRGRLLASITLPIILETVRNWAAGTWLRARSGTASNPRNAKVSIPLLILKVIVLFICCGLGYILRRFLAQTDCPAIFLKYPVQT